MHHPSIKPTLGAHVERTDQVAGDLMPNKPWTCLAFYMSGAQGTAKVTLMAEGKLKVEDHLDDKVMQFEYHRKASLYDQLRDVVFPGSFKDEQYIWKIISMQAMLPENSTVTIVDQGQLLTGSTPVKTPAESTEQRQGKGELNSNRTSQAQSALWRVLVTTVSLGVAGMALWIYIYNRKKPIVDGQFITQALSQLKTNERLKEEIGAPFYTLRGSKGYLSRGQTQGYAKVSICGPKGFVDLIVKGKKSKEQKEWIYTEIVLLKDNNKLNLL
jgi:hypothetical protein